MGEPLKRAENQYYTIEGWQKTSGLVAGFSTKHGGVSRKFDGNFNLAFHVQDDVEFVQRNRQILADRLGFPLSGWAGAEQTHEDHVQKVSRLDRGKGAREYETSFPHTDGLYTDEKGVLLVLAFADCVPIFYYAPKFGRVGIAHAGWKGTTLGIAAKMVEKWGNDGIPKEDIQIVIGPSICGTCYIVDERVIRAARRWTVKETELPYVETTPGQYALDLKALNKLILKQTGIADGQIRVTGLCTSCREEDFFSHRRDRGHTGRMLGFIGIKE